MLAKVLTGFVVAGLVLTSSLSSAQEYPRMTIRLAHFAPAAWSSSQVDQFFADEVNKRSKGQITIQIFWAEAMGKATEIVDLTSNGAVEMGATALVYFPAKLPLAGMTTGVPGIFRDVDQALNVNRELLKGNKPLLDEYRKNNIYPVVRHALAPYRLQCRKPVRTIEDLKGLKVRSFGALNPRIFAAFGMVPVNMLLPEIYEGLQRGTIDCAFLSNEIAVVLRLQEVAKFWSDINWGASAAYSSLTSWTNWHEKWPRNVVALMEEVSAQALELERKKVKELDVTATEVLAKANAQVVKFVDQDKLWQAIPDVLNLWAELATKQGVAGAAEYAAEIRRLKAKH